MSRAGARSIGMALCLALSLALAVGLALALAPAPAAGEQSVTLCHATGSDSAPYVAAVVPAGDLLGHGEHPGDIVPAPAGGCPASVAPAPVATSPTTTAAAPEATEATVCHAESGRFVELAVTPRGRREHAGHSGDLVPAPAGGCPSVAARAASAQARRRGGRASARSDVRALPATLPLTGADPVLVALLGVGLILTGFGTQVLLAVRSPRRP